MTTRFPRKILVGTIVLLACACTRGVAGGAVQLSTLGEITSCSVAVQGVTTTVWRR